MGIPYLNISVTFGNTLSKKDCKYNINGLVRIDYAPAWFVVGLFFEKILNFGNSRSHAK